MNNPNGSISDFLIAFLSSGRSSYQFHKILRERALKKYHSKSVRVTLSRLKSKGYINNSDKGWSVTTKGLVLAQQKRRRINYLPSPFNKESKNKNIIVFDIPEKERPKRDWLRKQIKIYNYIMIQQSVWVGPGPLPKEFLQALNDLHIREKIKILSISSLNS